MKNQKPFLTIEKGTSLSQIQTHSFRTVAEAMSETHLAVVDFETVMRMRGIDRETAIREYMLLKIGMFESWEILYNLV